MADAGIAPVSGYLHRAYAESFNGIASVRELPRCGGWILERDIPGSPSRDAMGCYPLFCCRDWTRLADDVAELGAVLVSLTLVTDPFGAFEADDLRRGFDVVRRYKPHHVTDLSRARELPVTRRHRRNTSRALRAVLLERIDDPQGMAAVWNGLYAELLSRHHVTGLRAFSPECLRRQLAVPGLRAFAARSDGHVIGVHLWYVQGDIAYGHLGATSARGYELMASYALYAFAIEQLRAEARWLDLGSSPGVAGGASGRGLLDFKAGWATGTRDTYLCGRILQPDVYRQLAGGRADALESSYFPVYRTGELAAAPADSEDDGAVQGR